MSKRSLAVLLLLSVPACESTAPPASVVGGTSPTLPFDPKDPSATFSASVLVQGVDGSHPSASLVYDGKTYTSDATGLLTVPAARVADQLSGVRITAAGFLSRSVSLRYNAAAPTTPMRVILEKAAITETFSAQAMAKVSQGPMTLTFPADSVARADGSAYAGTVHLAALAVDPVQSVIQMDENGLSLRPDFDKARIPQGYSLAAGADGNLRFLMPESLFQVELTDDAGQPLSLVKPVTSAYTLSSLTQHKAGDVLPTYSFDEANQRWKQDGTCTAALNTDGKLACTGSNEHFSTWMVASATDSTSARCANVVARFKTAGNDTVKYSVSLSGLTDTDVVGTNANQVSATLSSSGGQCAFWPSNVNSWNANIVMTDLKKQAFFGKVASGTTAYFSANLPALDAASIPASTLSQQKLDDSCMGCPVTVIDIDLTGAASGTTTPPTTTEPKTCTPTCASGATCTDGVCVCPASAPAYSSKGCQACPEGTTYKPSTLRCEAPTVTVTQPPGDMALPVPDMTLPDMAMPVPDMAMPVPDMTMPVPDMTMPVPDMTMPPCGGLCDPNATCLGASCECNAGYTGDGITCTPIGGGGSADYDLTSIGSGSSVAGPSVTGGGGLTLGAGITYNAFMPLFISGVRLDGLSGTTEAYVRLYDSSGTEVASGMNTSVTGSSAEISFTMGYMLMSEPMRISVWLFDGALSVYQPASFPYDINTGTISVTGGFTGTGDAYPTTSQSYIPAITLHAPGA